MNVLTIDDKKVKVPERSTILDAAEKAGIYISTMCFLEPYKPSTSGMACTVRLLDSGQFVPSCGRMAEDGMAVDTRSEVVFSPYIS